MTHAHALALSLSLRTAVERGLVRDPAVLQARAATHAAAAQTLAARAGSAPQLFVSYANAPQSGSAGTIAQRSTIVGIGKTFEIPALTGAQTAAARSGQQAVDEALIRARGEATVRIVGDYLGAVVAGDQAAIAADAVGAAKRVLDAAQLRLQSGDGPAIAVDQATAAYASAQAVRAAADGRRDAAYVALDLAVGLDPSARPALQEPAAAITAVPNAAAALAAALRARPDLRSADAEVRAARASLRAAELAYAPSLDVSAGRQSGIDTGVPVAGGTVSVSLHLPLDTSGAMRAQVERARAELDGALARREEVRRSVVQDVESATADVRSAQVRVAAEARAVDAARRAAAAAALGFSQGVTSAVDVLLAQSQYAAARGSLISAEADAVKARYALRTAEGVDPDVIR